MRIDWFAKDEPIDDEGIIYKSTTKEIWESCGKDLPESTESEDE